MMSYTQEQFEASCSKADPHDSLQWRKISGVAAGSCPSSIHLQIISHSYYCPAPRRRLRVVVHQPPLGANFGSNVRAFAYSSLDARIETIV